MGVKISELPLAQESNNNDLFVTVQDGATKKITKEKFLELVTQQLINIYTKTETDNLLNEKANQDDLDQTNVFVTNLTNRMDSAEANVMDLQSDSGAAIEISVDSDTYILTANLKNKAGNIVSTANVDLPLESLVKDIQYDSTTKEIIFILEDGTTRRVPIADLISGLVNEDDFNELEDRVTDLEKEVEILSETVNSELEDGTATGESITANDSARAKAKLVIGGNTKQVTTEGYQLFDKDNVTIVMGSIGANGENVSSDTRARTTFIELLEGETYVLSSSNNKLQIVLYYYNSSNGFISYDSGWKSLPFSFTIPTNASKVRFIFKNSQTNTIDLQEITDLMLEKGTTAHSWEKYTGGNPAPNPTYPQTVQVVKGNNEVKIQNKNFLKLEFATEQTKVAGLDFTYTNSSFKLSGTTTNTTYKIMRLAYIPYVQKGETYIFSKNITGISPKIQISLTFYGADGNLGVAKLTSTNTRVSFTPNFSIEEVDHVNFIIEGLSAQDNYDCYVEVQLEKGEEKTTWQEHEEQTLELTLPEGMEMCNIGDYGDEFVIDLSTGKWYKNEKINKLIFNGTENWAINNGVFYLNSGFDTNLYVEGNKVFCNKYLGVPAVYNASYITENNTCSVTKNPNLKRIYIKDDSCQTVEDLKSSLSNSPATMYYILKDFILEELTDPTLISQLDKLYEVMTYYGQTNVIVEAEDIPPIMTLNYKKSNRILRSEIDTIKARLVLLES